MTLLEAEIHSVVRIEQISLAKSRIQAIRLGLGPGTMVQVVQKLPRGPVVVMQKGRNLAIGYELARHIVVNVIS
ncbi:MAG: ferrous iron transport protein A [Firmicutes bacterium]|jgi:Fe2+ transport system protein FeoA|nr:ferrous iron transport protein A [Bacillota bacterium]